MNRTWATLFAIASLQAWPFAASACRPHMQVNAGFIHADVLHLPPNARGALFLAPPGDLRLIHLTASGTRIYSGHAPRIRASDFSINAGGNMVAARLTALDYGDTTVPAWRAYRFVSPREQERRLAGMKDSDVALWLEQGVLQDITAEVRELEGKLLRVGPEGGFHAGVRYTVTYSGPDAARGWAYPATATHEIDRGAPVASAAYVLRLDGPPVRRSMVAPDTVCDFYPQPALVQDFHLEVPASTAPYLGAILFFAEVKEGKPGQLPDWGATTLRQTKFGRTSQRAGHELAYGKCDPGGKAMTIGGTAGLLEVDDHLIGTGVIKVDNSAASGPSCAQLARLPNPFNAGQPVTNRCDAPLGRRPASLLGPAYDPSPADLRVLAMTARPQTQQCALSALLERAISVAGGAAADRHGLLAILSKKLRSKDPDVVAATLSSIAGAPGNRQRAPTMGEAANWHKLLVALAPVLSEVVETQAQSNAAQARRLVEQAGTVDPQS